MAEKLICPKPGCDGEIINGICSKCGQEREVGTGRDKLHIGSVGFGFTDPVGGIKGEGGFSSSGGFCNR